MPGPARVPTTTSEKPSPFRPVGAWAAPSTVNTTVPVGRPEPGAAAEMVATYSVGVSECGADAGTMLAVVASLPTTTLIAPLLLLAPLVRLPRYLADTL